MNDVALLGLFTLAIAIGVFLGRWQSKKSLLPHNLFSPNKSYFQGLNFLLNEQPDKAVEEFVRLLEVNTYTLETHLALGKLMRKQGQVDRAIRIHQNLLSRPQLEEEEHHQVHLELARDFMAAGLYDRAETLLQEVIGESVELRSVAQRYLLDIYQYESEWEEAIEVARALLQSRYMKANPEARRQISRMIAHFYCQLAENAQASNDIVNASRYIDMASGADKTVIRVSMICASLENAQAKYRQAIKTIQKIESQSPEWFAACLPILLNACLKLNEEKGFDQFLQYVDDHLANNQSALVVSFVVEQLLKRTPTESHRLQQAEYLLTRNIDQHASLTASNSLVELKLDEDQPVEELKKATRQLVGQVRQMLEQQNFYRCGNCGFSGRQLHWRCPSCKEWDSIIRLQEPGTS